MAAPRTAEQRPSLAQERAGETSSEPPSPAEAPLLVAGPGCWAAAAEVELARGLFLLPHGPARCYALRARASPMRAVSAQAALQPQLQDNPPPAGDHLGEAARPRDSPGLECPLLRRSQHRCPARPLGPHLPALKLPCACDRCRPDLPRRFRKQANVAHPNLSSRTSSQGSSEVLGKASHWQAMHLHHSDVR